MNRIARRGNAQETRQGAWNRDHSKIRFAIPAASPPQQKRNAQRFVQHMRKWMRRIDRHRRKHRRHSPIVEILCELLCLCVEFRKPQHAYRLLRKLRQQLVVQTFVLISNKGVHHLRDQRQFFFRRKTIGATLNRTVLDSLQKTRNTHFHEFIKIIRGNRQEFHAFQQWVSWIARFFQHSPVEVKPLHMAVQVVTRVIK